MKKVIVIVLVILVIAGSIWYFINSNSTGEVKTDSAKIESQSKTEILESSMKDLISSGKDQKCTFEVPAKESTGSGKGTFYITNGKSRGDIEVSISGGAMKSHIISDSKTAYFWVDESDTAFKMNLDQATAVGNNRMTPIDTSSNYKFNCESWKVDQSKFVLPNFEFREFTIPTIPEDINKPSNICDSLPEPARSECYKETK